MSVNYKIIAGHKIPAFTVSLPFIFDIKFEKIFIYDDDSQPLKIFSSQNGILFVDQLIDLNEHWANYLEIAKNCSEQNVVLNKLPNSNQYQLCTTRLINSNEILKFWPNRNLLFEFKIMDFLQLSNIISYDKYKCVSCLSVFKEPNELKIHIALNCQNSLKEVNVFNIDNHVKEIMCSNNDLILSYPNQQIQTKQMNNFTFNNFIDCKNEFSKEKIPLNDCFDKKNLLIENFKNSLENSQSFINAYKNFSNVNINNFNHIKTFQANSNSNSSSIDPINSNLEKNLVDSDISSDTTDEIISEKVISSSMNIIVNKLPIKNKTMKMTKEPRSHTCIFCGKLYTRKYGLKIHIRTHTGHKPLKCIHCTRPFSDPSNLNKHMRLHQQNRQWTKQVDLKS